MTTISASHIETRLVHSPRLSEISGHNIFLKLENEQLGGSFKPRGISSACNVAVALALQRGSTRAHLVAASGGNAGIACAIAVEQLRAASAKAAAAGERGIDVQCTVFVHCGTEPDVIDAMRSRGAEVRVLDGEWDAVRAAAADMVRDLQTHGEEATFIHPFEGEGVVEGHKSLVHEVYEQFGEAADGLGEVGVPDIFCCSIGGGGLMRGLLRGMTERQAMAPLVRLPLMLAIAPDGTDGLHRSLALPSGVVQLTEATSWIKSLNCSLMTPRAVYDARAYGRTGSAGDIHTVAPPHELDVISQSRAEAETPDTYASAAYPHFASVRITDSHAAAAAVRFREDGPAVRDTGARPVVEAACGAALVPAYMPAVLARLVDDQVKEMPRDRKLNVVIVVCGGKRVSEAVLKQHARDFGTGSGKVDVDGVVVCPA